MKNVSVLFNIVLGLIIIILLILIFSTNYHIITIDTDSISKYSQEISQIDSVYISLNKSDIQKAISILEKGNISNDDLLKSLESQKETFVLIIVFLTLLIAAAGLFSIVQNLTSQAEQEKLKKLTKTIKDEIKEINFASIMILMSTKARHFDNYSYIYSLESGKVVNSKDTFIQHIEEVFTEFDTELNKIGLSDKFYNDNDNFNIICNFINNSISYAKENKFIPNTNLIVGKNDIFKYWLLKFSAKMNNDEFIEFKKYFTSFYDDVDFGEF